MDFFNGFSFDAMFFQEYLCASRCHDVKFHILKVPGKFEDLVLIPVSNGNQHSSFKGKAGLCSFLGFKKCHTIGIGHTQNFSG